MAQNGPKPGIPGNTPKWSFWPFWGDTPNPWIWTRNPWIWPCEQVPRIYPDFGLFSPIFGPYVLKYGPKWPKIGVVREGAQITLFG